jgi:hypothetical protein
VVLLRVYQKAHALAEKRIGLRKDFYHHVRKESASNAIKPGLQKMACTPQLGILILWAECVIGDVAWPETKHFFEKSYKKSSYFCNLQLFED